HLILSVSVDECFPVTDRVNLPESGLRCSFLEVKYRNVLDPEIINRNSLKFINKILNLQLS
ncbi:MAG: hypothetical protein PHX26_05675, partial [Proteiniphilum sp.]|nr:hypothetical protein [Proteiniphilum sp.]